MIEETSAGIVLFRKEETKKLFLLLHYPSGHWDFVKGKMEKMKQLMKLQSEKQEKKQALQILHL